MLPALNPVKLTSDRLGQGGYRTTFRIADTPFVVKLAHGSWGGREESLYGNRNEAAGWVEVSDNPEVSALFCPVLAADVTGHWLVMPLCTPLVDDYGNFTEDDGCRLFLQARNAARPYVEDLHSGNIMLLDGRAVVTDYGFGVNAPDPDVTPPPGPGSECCGGEGYEGDCACECSPCMARFDAHLTA